jgi:hypothetical protein
MKYKDCLCLKTGQLREYLGKGGINKRMEKSA